MGALYRRSRGRFRLQPVNEIRLYLSAGEPKKLSYVTARDRLDPHAEMRAIKQRGASLKVPMPKVWTKLISLLTGYSNLENDN